MNWWEWVFSGVGVFGLGLLLTLWKKSRGKNEATLTAQGSKVTDSPVASGTGITQTVNSPTFNVALPSPAPSAPGTERYNEWRELIHELHESFQQMGYAFLPINVIKPGIENNDYEAGIRRGYRVLRNRILIADVLKNAGMLEKFKSIVEYAVSAQTPRDPSQRGCPTMTGFDIKASQLEDELMELARNDSGLIPAETLRPASPIPTPQPSEPAAAPAAIKPRRPLPNMVMTGARACRVTQIERGVWSENLGYQNALAVQFTNEAMRDSPNLGGLVKAHLVYRCTS